MLCCIWAVVCWVLREMIRVEASQGVMSPEIYRAGWLSMAVMNIASPDFWLPERPAIITRSPLWMCKSWLSYKGASCGMRGSSAAVWEALSKDRCRESIGALIYRLDVYWWSDGVDVYIIAAGVCVGCGVAVSLVDVGCYEVVDGVVEGFEHDRVEPVFGAHGGEFEGLFFAKVCFEFADHGVWAVVVASRFFDDGVGDGFWGAVVEVVEGVEDGDVGVNTVGGLSAVAFGVVFDVVHFEGDGGGVLVFRRVEEGAAAVVSVVGESHNCCFLLLFVLFCLLVCVGFIG